MKYVLGVLAVIFVAVLAIVLIVSGGNGGSSQTKSNISTKLVDLATPDSRVTFTTQGRLVGDHERRGIRITVDEGKRTIQVLAGYDQDVIKSKSYSNNDTAYQYFLAALDQAGFKLKRTSTVSDSRGACPAGSTYLYQLNDGKSNVIDSWATECSSRQGNLGTNSGVINQLFQTQIPDYDTIANPVEL